ncbi:glycosyl transferase family protein [Bermanella marisrubri]|uniref:Anthranilate phosphoribosyltransferase n=1 Tax=Bermanella marisrubri TaxID=207949 RepID=Q1N6X4_9GAMM|nr:glycosyl transferase family protein [Bermanella marisrubri]EAT13468.1 Anthranilate phosphoribosyltransferase [Oceanobacter sp. RED65] [Bermanella marisrubri]QIZ84271.1 glycosyl transferase family protein [Bermanella marisrubri]
MSIEHPFAPYVRILGKGRKGSRSYTYEEAHTAMGMILRGEVEDVQLGAVMMLLRVKEENAEELSGFAQATREHIQDRIPNSIQADLDWSSYAGKRRQLPWYLLAALCLADNGIKVFMHGADGHTAGRLYSKQVLEELGVTISGNWQDAEDRLNRDHFCFMDMSVLCPELQKIIDLRNTFGLRSPVHSFARLLNPTNAPFVSQGIFHPGYGPSHQKAADLLDYKHLSIIKGDGGECEYSPESQFKMHHCFNGELIEEVWPALWEKRGIKPKTLEVELLAQHWKGDITHEYGQDAIRGTLAYIARLMGKGVTQEECLTQADAWWQARNIARLR